MRVFVALACLLVNCLAQKPQPCDWPPKMTGEAMMNFTDDDTGVKIRYVYDAVGQRIRVFQNATQYNKTTMTDSLLLLKEEVMYVINDQNRTCTKLPFKADFIPLGIPKTPLCWARSSSAAHLDLVKDSWSTRGREICPVEEVRVFIFGTI
ncbi:mammalian ependymin-related protein 1-like isoform X1 [Cheilinus undulatus]|uniref:mammalian ependymin-related protein 1-like isoform X1 n=1 Tax=Cheilinus undulatus TaxID=241271 RepID=UPI001BD63757|nr:mammalian ependymin-related protein 1-like isoform X1 [Cheilinus undulatus]